jgi:hypothetical protein
VSTPTDAGDPDEWEDTGPDTAVIEALAGFRGWVRTTSPGVSAPIELELWPADMLPTLHTHTAGGLLRIHGTPGGVSAVVPSAHEGGVSCCTEHGGRCCSAYYCCRACPERGVSIPTVPRDGQYIGDLAQAVVEQGLGVAWVALPDSVQQQIHRALEVAATYRAAPTHPPTPTPDPVVEVVGARMGDPCTRCPHVMVMHTRDGCQASRCECKVTKRWATR